MRENGTSLMRFGDEKMEEMFDELEYTRQATSGAKKSREHQYLSR